MQDFRNLDVWRKSHELTLSVCRASSRFPNEEMYGLTRQLRRCCASVPANIAEGCGRGGDADFRRFLQIAMGSASEAEYHLLLARDLGMLHPGAHQTLAERITEVKRMLTVLIRKLKADSRKLIAHA